MRHNSDSVNSSRRFPDFFRFILIPAFLLAALLLTPGHGVDLAVSHFFYSNGWPWHDSESFGFWTHTVPKFIPSLIAAAALVFYAVKKRSGTLSGDLAARLRYLVISMLVCVLSIWWLKQTTGVYCPWSVTEFGGSHPISSPAFSFRSVPGNCWPAGHAGTGFCLFGLYFAFRGYSAKLTRAGLIFALALGVFCGGARVMQGAHFLSHVIASGLIDWLIAASFAYVLLRFRAFPIRRKAAEFLASGSSGRNSGARTSLT